MKQSSLHKIVHQVAFSATNSQTKIGHVAVEQGINHLPAVASWSDPKRVARVQ